MDARPPPPEPSWTRPAAWFSMALLAGAVAFFFRQEVLSTLSDVSGGDVTWARQLLHNAVHGRLFESSVCHNSLGGVVHNPWAYANNTGNHVNLTPYFFGWLYALWPTLAGYYAVSLLAQYGGLALFFWLAARSAAAVQAEARAWLVVALLLLSAGLFWTATFNGLFPLYLAPFFAAMVYALEADRPVVYAASLVLALLVSEDSAMFLSCFGFTLAALRPERRRWGVATWLAGALWSAAAVLWLQPAARVGMELSAQTNMADRLMRTTTADGVRRWLGSLLELLRAVAVFAPALAFAALSAGRTLKETLREALPMLFLAPAVHWLVTIMAGGGHHWMPVFLCLFYILLRLLCAPGAAPLPATASGLARPAAAALGVYFALNTFGLYYKPVKYLVKGVVLPPLLGYPAPDHSAKVAHNLRVLEFVDSIPAERSVTYFINDYLTAYTAGRSDFWWFPAYFDQADLLLIDKDGTDFEWRKVDFRLPSEVRGFLESLVGPDGRVPAPKLALLRDRLAGPGGTHRVLRDDADLLVLERLSPGLLPASPTSRGLSFLRRGPRADGSAFSNPGMSLKSVEGPLP
ncbi:MAG: DUF2079 domain-containing protein [Elusimicrobia bacterium]|nr:DUF2079 domain-containing protein [Elusimicrobiota bacterium]